jgi:16S rRNA pseudouridine516 synthase
VRLAPLLARNLGVSRGVARDLLAAGRVTFPDAATPPDPRGEIPEQATPLAAVVDGRPVRLWTDFHAVLHKPAGVVTALRDPVHPVAAGLLRDAPLASELRPVGRLDRETTGLLLWTTEGPWLQRLTHPRRAVERTYQAALARPFAPPPDGLTLDDGHRPSLAELGVIDDPGALHPALLRPGDARIFATITLTGGAYHEVRRIFAALGSHVLALCRIRFGQLTLPTDLPPGAWRAIAKTEVDPTGPR